MLAVCPMRALPRSSLHPRHQTAPPALYISIRFIDTPFIYTSLAQHYLSLYIFVTLLHRLIYDILAALNARLTFRSPVKYL